MINGCFHFDCNACYGQGRISAGSPPADVETLLAEMDWHGVDRALVHHALMRDHSPVVGNQMLADGIMGHERLVGSWAILPPQTGELPAGQALYDAMAAANVRALWAYPDDHRYLLNRLTFGALLDEVSERRIPLFIPRDAVEARPGGTWELVTRLLAEYPALTLVVTAHGPWGEDRYFRPLLDAYPGLHIGISRYELDGGLVELVERYGASRLLYGSNYPLNAMGGPLLMLARAVLSDEDRAAIAGGNLARLLEGAELS